MVEKILKVIHGEIFEKIYTGFLEKQCRRIFQGVPGGIAEKKL